MKLTPNFHLDEFKSPDGEAMPAVVLENIKLLASRLQVLRDLLEKPITIMSGYRSDAHNQKIGGVAGSYHVKGMAADIEIEGMPPSEVQQFLVNWSGGLGSYNHHTHLDIRPVKARWKGLSK